MRKNLHIPFFIVCLLWSACTKDTGEPVPRLVNGTAGTAIDRDWNDDCTDKAPATRIAADLNYTLEANKRTIVSATFQ